MQEYIVIGSSPASETCAQVGAPDYHEQNRRELQVFKHQIERMYPEQCKLVRLGTKKFAHDFGPYTELVAFYEDSIQSQIDAAYDLEHIPEYWDEQAKIELGITSTVGEEVNNG